MNKCRYCECELISSLYSPDDFVCDDDDCQERFREDMEIMEQELDERLGDIDPTI